MKKVVINSQIGGFRLTDKQYETYLTLKGIRYKTVTTNSLYTDFYDEDDNFLSYYEIDRECPVLIEMVENMTDEETNLVVIEIPSDVNYRIQSYDGIEHIAEEHRTWS